MMATFLQSSTMSSRLASLLSGVLLATAAFASVPALERTTHSSKGLVRAQTEVAAEAQPTQTPKEAGLNKNTIAAYLVRDWKLAKPYATQVATAVLASAERHALDPLLILAVAATESSFKHTVGNPGGGWDPMKPFGIMQVNGQFHPDKFPGGQVRATSVSENLDIGARVLKEYLMLERGNERRALLRYNGSLNISDKYARQVDSRKQQVYQGLQDVEKERDSVLLPA